MVHKLQIPANYKYYHLINVLRGEAAEKIKHIPVVGENYITAWDTLVNYYENKRRLVSQQVHNLMSIKPMESECFSEIKRIYRSTFDVLQALKSLDRSVEKSGTDIVVTVTVNKLEVNTRKDWEKALGNFQEPPSLEKLKTFLEEHMMTQESIEEGVKVNPTSNQKPVRN